MNRSKDSAGFTLVEMILVLVVLAILLAVAVPKFINLMDQTVESNRCATSRGAINSALAVTYGAILLADPTQGDWLDNATMAVLDDSMFTTGQIPICSQHGTLSIADGQSVCSIHN